MSDYQQATATPSTAQNATDAFLDPAVRLLLAMINENEYTKNMNF